MNIALEDITENIAIIKINKSYREGMTPVELYDRTRGCWKRKLESVEKAEYVLSVVFGEVKEVYKVNCWTTAEKLNRETRPYNPETDTDRIGFIGEVAEEPIRGKYIGNNVSLLYKQGEADPVKIILRKRETVKANKLEWWPSKYIYDPGLTVKQWVEILNNKEITTDNNLRMFAEWIDYGRPAACSEIADYYGETKNFFNAGSSALARRIVDNGKCQAPPDRDNENARWWPVLYVGRDALQNEKGSYIWKLREEVKQALLQIELPKVRDNMKMSIDNKTSLNTILYGPPGTGKTYNTVKLAVNICDPEFASSHTVYDDFLKRYNELKEDGRIAFTTFHQSYGYEEFIEGIKPVISEEDIDDEAEANIEYTIASGIFKRFCEKASLPALRNGKDYGFNEDPTVWKVSLSKTYDNPVRTECLKNGHIRIGWDEYGPDITDVRKYENGGRVSLNAFIYRMREGDIVFSCYSQSTIDAIGVITGEYEWDDSFDEYKRVRKVNWILKKSIDIRKLNNGRNMVQSTIYRMSITASDVVQLLSEEMPIENTSIANIQPDNYVFIIDEINRGNISKIFGELITLIEESKRIGNKEEMRAILPYSNKPFGVPNNVYILGTMNTADRSIALMDTALRRRFCFEEMMPDTEIIADVSISDGNETLYVSKMLETINKRIEYLYDREHTIGHAFFTDLRGEKATLKELAKVFKNKVVPLLQEYFYEDYEKIQLVLGDNDKSSDDYKFILDRKVNENEIFKKSPQLDLHEKIFEIQEGAFGSILSYIEIYETRKAEE